MDNQLVKSNSESATVSDQTVATSEVPETETSKPKSKFWGTLIEEGDFEAARENISRDIKQVLQKHGLEDYCTLLLYNERRSISNYDADKLYSAATAIPEKTKNILLLIHSTGGRIEPAYLIGKTLKRFSKDKFVVAVPRRAKSAATLISLGADQIHMGHVSELGPIDPQINGIPALALADAFDTVAKLASTFPDASGMLGKYLIDQAPMKMVGYYKRITESAVQYAERLLGNKQLAENMSSNRAADHLVNHYKDHGFVIDIEEATRVLGTKIVRQSTPEYKAADEIYRLLDLVEFVSDKNGKQMWYVGSVEEGLYFYDKKDG